MNDQSNLYSFQLYHASGLKVFFAFPFASFAETSAAIEQALAAGFTVDPRGVEPGEMIEEIGYVLRSTQVSTRDGTITPKIALYPAADHLQHKLAHYWLNTEDDIAAFEAATGLKLANIPIYPADNYPARDARSMQHFVKLPKPAKAVYKLNPAYTEGSTTEAKRHFVRWHSAAPAPQAEQQPDKPAQPKAANGAHVWTPQEAAAFVSKWKARGYGDDILRVLNITRMGECKLAIADADYLMEQHAVNTILNVEQVPQ